MPYITGIEIVPQEIAFTPYDAVNRLAGSAANSADGEGLWRLLRGTVVASRDTLLDDLNLTIEPGCSALHQWYICRQTQLVHVSPRIQVIQRIEDDLEAAEPWNIELDIFDVGVVCDDLDVGIKRLRRVLGHLCDMLAYFVPKSRDGGYTQEPWAF